MKKKVMLIDDDEDEHNLFSHHLANHGSCYELNSCFDGVQAINALDQCMPDYIFLDINMPKMKGLEVLKRLKNIIGLKTIPIFMYSTSKELLDELEALKHGAVAFFKKPLDGDGFKKIFQSVLKCD